MKNSTRQKTCLITGSNRGIGRAVAEQVAERGFQVIIASRSRASGEATVGELIATTGNQNIAFEEVDLSSIASIRRLAVQVSKRYEKLDILVNNAATIPRQREMTPDGIEMQFAVNHLGAFAITNLLLPVMLAGKGGRVITVSSNVHFSGTLDLNPRAIDKYDRHQVYKNTKLLNVLFTYELAHRLFGTGITATAVRPGTINTQLVGDYLWPMSVLRRVFPSANHGAEPITRLVCAAEESALRGRYFDRFKERRSAPITYDRQLQGRLWETSEELSGISFPLPLEVK